MRRPLLALWLLSFLPLLFTLTLWARSFHREDFVRRLDPAVGSYSAWSRDGRLSLWTDRYFEAKVLQPKAERAGWDYKTKPMTKPDRWPDHTRGTLGFVRDADKTGKAPWAAVAIPYWSIAAALAIPPAVGLWFVLRRRRRARQGHCTGCGYDLRASSGRCPECGLAIPRKSDQSLRASAPLTMAGCP